MVELSDREYQKILVAREIAEGTINTIREPLIILDGDLKVVSASRSFYQTFKVKPEETEHKFIYELGNNQWDIPKLRQLLESILPNNESFDNYEVEHYFPLLGKRIMILNARRIPRPPAKPLMILLAMEDVTERRDKEEKYFRALIENSDDVVTVIDSRGMVNYQSPNYRQVWGRDPSGEIGKDLYKDVHPDDTALVSEKFAHLLEEPGGLANFRVRAKREDGSWRCLDIVAKNLINDPAVRGMVVNFRDVTARKRMEDDLKESEEKYRVLVEQALEGITIAAGPPPKLVFANPALARMLGYSTDELLGLSPQGVHELIHPANQEMFFQRFAERLAGQQPTSHYEFRAITKDKRTIWLEISSTRINYQGKFAVQAIFSDITARKRAEEEIIAKNKEFNLIDSLNKAANTHASIDTIIALLSKETSRLFSCPGSAVYLLTTRPDELELQNFNISAEILGLIEKLIGGKIPKVKIRLEAGSKYLANLRQPGITVISNRAEMESMMAELARPFGLQHFLPKIMDMIGIRAILSIPLILNDKPIGLIELSRGELFTAGEIESFTRISNEFNLLLAHRRAEEEIKILNIELEQKVAERTAQLQNTNRELEAFNYSVSHDLQAPLRSIGGFSRALLEDYTDKLDEQGKAYLRRVCASTERAAELINDLLGLSSITQAKLQKEEVDLSAVARSVFDELKSTVPSRQIELLTPENLRVQADKHLIRIVLTNLLDNAFKFTSPHPTARIELGAEEKDGNKFFFIKDDGVGLNPAYVDRLFTPFQRLHSESEFPGTGIGLAIVRRIILRHGGEVWAEGEEGKGASFYFTLN